MTRGGNGAARAAAAAPFAFEFPARDWARALTLAERARLAAPTAPEGERRAEAGERVARWRREAGLQEDRWFEAWLAGRRLTLPRLLALVAETPESLAGRTQKAPAWVACLEGAWRESPSPAPHVAHEGDASWDLLDVLSPLVRQAEESLRRAFDAARCGAFVDVGRVFPDARRDLHGRLFASILRTMLVVLHEERRAGLLPGPTPESRYGSFTASLADPTISFAILCRYPVLAQTVVQLTESWHAAWLELVGRLEADRSALRAAFAEVCQAGRIVAIETGLSDRHLGGRSVARLQFEDGTRLVYKPKPLAADALFGRLLAWLDARVPGAGLRRLRILDRGGYGYTEHVEAGPCADLAAVGRFHRRQGMLAAALYALDATDIHLENVMAAGEHPVLVDVETIAQPHPRVRVSSGQGLNPVCETALRSGLLPRRGWAHADPGDDLSGLTGRGGQKVRALELVEIGTDRMRLEPTQTIHPDAANRPRLPDGTAPDAWLFADDLARGFDEAYAALRAGRKTLARGPLRGLARLETRVLLRGTGAYALLVAAAQHPDFLRDGLDRERLFDRLWLDVRNDPCLAAVALSEAAALGRGDVPRFAARAGSRRLLACDGSRRAAFFEECGAQRVARRLRALCSRDLARQRFVVRGSLESLRPLDHFPRHPPRPLPRGDSFSAARLRAVAGDLGRRLATLAVRYGDREIVFFQSTLDEGERPAFQPVRTHLYDGLAGVALFLAHLGATLREQRHTELARAVLRSCRRRLAAPADVLGRVGAFAGWGGWVYALVHLGLLWRDAALVDEAEAALPRVEAALPADRGFDVVGGAAGAIAALLALDRARPTSGALNLAAAAGQHLLAHAHVDGDTLSWPTNPEASGPGLTGFAHGAAGIAWALGRLAVRTGDGRFSEGAARALAYERRHFDEERGGWPDLRESRRAEGRAPLFHAWCHGAPGIGLARLELRDSLDDPRIDGEARRALQNTLEHGFGESHCLCHGDLGNLELVQAAAAAWDDAGLARHARRLAMGIAETIAREGPRSGASPASELPGLLTGLAGIGYGLLRAADVRRVPSVLRLELPEVAVDL